MKKAYDIVIVGGGLIGSAFALWLSKHTDYRLALIERSSQAQKPSNPNQRVVALGHIAVEVLRDVGVFSTLGQDAAYPYHRMSVWDENSDGELEFDATDTNQDQLGYMVDSVYCTSLLQRRVADDECIDSYFNCNGTALHIGSQASKLTTDEGVITAKLIVAADGSNSWVRQQAKIFTNRKDYGQRGIVARVKVKNSHEDCAWQRFLSTGPLAFLHINENQCSIVWSVETALADELMALSDEAFSERLSSAFERRLGKVTLASTRQAFSLQSQRAERYYRHNVVLLGDAAHSVHPLAGQGANLGFKDLLCLGGLLKDVTASEVASPNTLARYQRLRKRDNEQTDALMSALNTVYGFDSSIWMVLRGTGMNWLSKRSAIRALLAKQAMGLD